MLLIFYYRFGWLQLKSYASRNDQVSLSTVISVIIPARNEEKNIYHCINSIIQQTYPSHLYEVIVIDDYSTDSTASIALTFAKQNIKVIRLSDFEETKGINSYKKKAIEIAIGFTKGTLIVTTDADCIHTNEWLETIASYYENAKSAFIAAPVAYRYSFRGNSFLKNFFYAFQCLDFMMLQGITAASAYKSVHSMCNGANLAYEKKVFYEVDGFKGIDSVASGDDMLLMHKIQKKHPGRLAYLKSSDCIAYTLPAETCKEFINQRIRWASKADKYKDGKITSVLFLVYFFNAWLFSLAVFSFFNLHAFYCLLVLLSFKTISELYFLLPVAKFFNEKKILRYFIPAQPVHIVYTLIAGWLGKFGSYTWKDRKVK